jgi:quercetin dioxygenase-like cupin family protein
MHRPKMIPLFALAWAVAAPGLAETPTPPLAIDAGGSTVKWGGCPPIFPGACAMTVLQGDPAKPNSDVVLRIGPQTTLPRHKHSSAERMILLSGRLLVKYDGAPASLLKPSNYAYGPAGLPHVATCQSKVPCLLFIAFEGPVDAELVEKSEHAH